jgi:acetyl-CoA carboxylase biotin carboxyl carrier protein
VELSREDVQDILRLLDGLPFGELHLQTTRFSLWLRRTANGEWTQELQVRSEPAMSPGAVPAEPVPAEPAPAEPAPAEAGAAGPAAAAAPGGGAGPGLAERDEMRAVRAPLPGTFYRAPRPGAAPFVEVGSVVEPDTVVGIVETMKLMNSISAGVRGTVAQIAAANGQLAEQDTVLIWVREDR